MRICFLLLAVVFTLNVQAQGFRFSAGKVDASEVPQAVKDAQAAAFSGVEVTWSKQEAAGPNDNSGTRYIANFPYSGDPTRARYTKDGQQLLVSTYYRSGELPQDIQNVAADNYPDYQLIRASKNVLPQEGQTVFRLTLRNGAQKLTVFTDENGNEISRDDLPDDLPEEEG